MAGRFASRRCMCKAFPHPPAPSPTRGEGEEYAFLPLSPCGRGGRGVRGIIGLLCLLPLACNRGGPPPAPVAAAPAAAEAAPPADSAPLGTRKAGSDWPRFLGPFGTGVSPEKGILTK